MNIPKKASYIIIGAGIHGLSTAWHLAEKLKAISATKFRKIRLKDVPKSMRKTRDKKSPSK